MTLATGHKALFLLRADWGLFIGFGAPGTPVLFREARKKTPLPTTAGYFGIVLFRKEIVHYLIKPLTGVAWRLKPLLTAAVTRSWQGLPGVFIHY